MTKAEEPDFGFSIRHGDKLLLLGSCFSQNIQLKLRRHGFDSLEPFGAVYNPLSILSLLKLAASGEPYPESGAFERGGLWQSYDFHGSFSRKSKAEFLDNANARLAETREYMRECKAAFISLGTAWCYFLNDGGRVVANCHKTPAAAFTRRRLSAEECSAALGEISLLLPDARIVFTVSPIRHLKDGLHGNQLSKAALLLACDEICSREPSYRHYFPSYELLIDELRDYRFYAEDMAHPSPTAISYIWERFSHAFFDDETRALNAEIEKLRRMQDHRVIDPESAESRLTAEKIEQMKAALLAKNKHISL